MNNITVLDFAYWDSASRTIKGESLHVHASLSGTTNHQDFVYDFGPAKKLLKTVIDTHFDHCLLLPALDNNVERRESGHVHFAGGTQYKFPLEAVNFLPCKELTLAALAESIESEIKKSLPANIENITIQLEEDRRFLQDANFRYTHGLRLHEGNCQRLLHGHRNPIEVWQRTQRVPSLERKLASEWHRAHFAALSTVSDSSRLVIGRRNPSCEGLVEITYESPQGKFWAKIPAADLILTPSEPSIETIAALGLEILSETGLRDLTVIAYEGLNKGATASH